MLVRLGALMFVGLLLVGGAFAADSSFYVTTKLGHTSLDRDLELSPFDTVNEDGDSWTVGFGYRLNRHLAFQAEYLDLGEMEHTRLCGPPEMLCLSLPPLTLGTTGLSLGVVPQLPVGRHASVFGKIGLARLNTEARSLGRVESEVENDKVHYGAGLRFELWHQLSLVAEYDAAGSEVRNVSVGANLEF